MITYGNINIITYDNTLIITYDNINIELRTHNSELYLP